MNAAPQKLSQRRNISEVIGGSFDFYMRAPGPMFLAASPAILVSVVAYILGNLTDSDVANSLLPLLALPLQFIVYVLVGAALVAALLQLDKGETPSGGTALSAASDRMDDLLGAAFRSTVILVALCITIIGIPFAIVRGVHWAFISQSIMVDGQTSATALNHSAQLVNGYGWRTFWRLLGAGLVFAVISGVLGGVIAAALSGLLGAIVAGVIDAAVLPLSIIAGTLIFYDLKLIKSGVSTTEADPPYPTYPPADAPPAASESNSTPTS